MPTHVRLALPVGKALNLALAKHSSNVDRLLLDVESKKSYSIEKITEELKKDSSMIDFLQTHNMIPGSKVSIADAGEFSITITTDNNNYFGIDKFIAKRVFVV